MMPCKEQWYLFDNNTCDVNIKAQEMWKLLEGKKEKRNVVIAVIDSGVDISNEEITAFTWENKYEIPDNERDDDNNGYIDDINGWNFVGDNNNVSEFKSSVNEISHGTKIAGIICANHNIGKIYGITDSSCIKIMPIKVLGEMYGNNGIGLGEVDNVIDAIQYAEANGADICNISLNIDREYYQLSEVIKNSNMLFVASAGNRNGQNRNIDKYPSYPASYNYENVITVANVKSNGRLNSKSNYGVKSVDIAAPGTDIYGIDAGGKYSFGSGTSYAVPIVAGTAAMLYACDENMTGGKCKAILWEAADSKRGLEHEVHGGKILNCKNSIERVQ